MRFVIGLISVVLGGFGLYVSAPDWIAYLLTFILGIYFWIKDDIERH